MSDYAKNMTSSTKPEVHHKVLHSLHCGQKRTKQRPNTNMYRKFLAVFEIWEQTDIQTHMQADRETDRYYTDCNTQQVITIINSRLSPGATF